MQDTDQYPMPPPLETIQLDANFVSNNITDSRWSICKRAGCHYKHYSITVAKLTNGQGEVRQSHRALGGPEISSL